MAGKVFRVYIFLKTINGPDKFFTVFSFSITNCKVLPIPAFIPCYNCTIVEAVYKSRNYLIFHNLNALMIN